MLIHIVQRGESPYSIANEYGVPLYELMRINGIEGLMFIPVGMALVVPTDRMEYTVRQGQSIYSIARIFGTTADEILRANPQITDPANIQAGQVISVPAAGGSLGTIDVNGYAYTTISPETLNRTLPYLTYISPFSYEADADGNLKSIPDRFIVENAIERGTAPLMVVTNLSEEKGFDSDIIQSLLTNREAQDNLIANIKNTLSEKNYYGVDLDFEYIPAENSGDYAALIEKMAGELRPMGKSVSIALAPKLSDTQTGILYEGHDYASQGAAADFVTLMTYEWGYTYGPPQAVAPINEVERVISYAVGEIPPQKIMMGIPNYGYDWTIPYREGTAARTISNTGAINLAVSRGATVEFDPVAKAPYFYYTDDEGNRHVVWFEDARSIRAKLELVDKYGLRGVTYWTVNSYFPQNWAVLDSMFDVRKVNG